MSSKKNELQKFIPLEEQRLQNTLTHGDLVFWSNNPPDEVIFATGSIRKALMFVAQLNNFNFTVYVGDILITIDQPHELTKYFSEYIFNGNGTLKEKTFLGYLNGVPVFAEPSEGESASNEDPYGEARNKVMNLYGKYAGRHVLIVSTDTVDRPDALQVPLGKPENEPDFPKKDAFTFDGVLDEDSLDVAVRQYLEKYKQEFYNVSREMFHTNAVAILDAFTGMIVNLEKKLIELRVSIKKDLLQSARIYVDMGGGGVTQQFIDWDNPEAIREYFDSLVNSIFADQKDPTILKMALFCQISGSPYAIIELLRQASEEIQAISEVSEQITLGQSETVIFDSYQLV